MSANKSDAIDKNSTSEMFKATNCVLCGDKRSKLVVRGKDRLGRLDGEFDVVSCVSCGTWRLDPAPDASMMDELYPEAYEPYNRAEQGYEPVIAGLTHRLRRRYVEWVSSGKRSLWTLPAFAALPVLMARLFSRTDYGRFNPLAFVGEGRRVLDVGCATGYLMDFYRAHGWTTIGIDWNERAVKIAREKDHCVVQGRFPENSDEIDKWSPYYAVVFSNVLEHLENPFAALSKAWEVMEPGGYVLIWAPVSDGFLQSKLPMHWYNLDIPRHLHLFSKKGLQTLLRQCDFDVLAHWPATSVRATMRTFAALLRSKGRMKSADFVEKSRMARLPAGLAVRCADIFGQGDIAIVLAQKPKTTEPVHASN